MYIITDATELELPKAVCNTLNETAKVCNTTIPNICKTIKLKRITKIFDGLPSRIYKVEEFEDDYEENKQITVFEFCKCNCTYHTCSFKGNGIVRSTHIKSEVRDCVKSQIRLSK